MMSYFRRISPKAAVQDFAGEWQQPTPYRWHILGVAMAATFCIFMLFIPESQRMAPAPPQVVYISTFDAGRGDAEIIASNCANQRLKDELAEKLAQRAELRREAYRALGRATFIDVDAMQADIDAERAAEAAALAAEAEGAPAPQLTSDDVALSIEEYCARATAG